MCTDKPKQGGYFTHEPHLDELMREIPKVTELVMDDYLNKMQELRLA